MRFGKQHGRATCAKQPPLNFRYLQVWIDRMIDLDKLAGKLNYRLLAAALLEEVFHAKCEAQAAR